MKGHKVYIRKFLNKRGQEGAGAILAQFDVDSPGGQYEHASGEIHIGDCTRSITLNFNAYGEAALQNSLHKLDVLISTLEKYEAVVMAYGRDKGWVE